MRKFIIFVLLAVLFPLNLMSCDGGGGADEAPTTISLRVVGEEEVVFDWSKDRCDDSYIPDLPARAFRDDSGQVQLIANHENPVYRFIGPDLNNLTHECDGVMESHKDPDPAAFNYWEWIGATYTEDGKTIYAIIHNEYHGYGRDPECFDVSGGCWYNSLTLAVSTDSGASYHHPVTPPGHLIAAWPEQYVPGRAPYGIFHPSNIVKGKDGYYYSIWQTGELDLPSWQCLVRTDDLSNPKSWRFWDGAGFDETFINPYTEATENTEAHLCKPIDSFKDIDEANHPSSLTYNNYIDRYVFIAPLAPPYISGFYYSVSEDLISWSPFKLFYDVELISGEAPYMYPSLLDPDSETRNFETTGKKAYLYYTRLNLGLGNLDRDLVRVPVEFFKE